MYKHKTDTLFTYPALFDPHVLAPFFENIFFYIEITFDNIFGQDFAHSKKEYRKKSDR